METSRLDRDVARGFALGDGLNDLDWADGGTGCARANVPEPGGSGHGRLAVGNTVSLAVRALRQEWVGADLAAPLRDDETAWLDADVG